jgi:uncharacterized zinc-type alcohol dehydrogenase-like protein
MSKIQGWAATAPGKPLVPFSYDPGPLGAEEVEVAVEYCGLCHSDFSVLKNDWQNTTYPVVPGHEVVGRVVALGEQAKGLKVGDRVGIGWSAQSCMHCHECLSGDHQLCATVVPTILGHHGGFADRVRAHWAWAIPLPEGIDMATTGPLLCGGVTVFTPLAAYGIRPTDRVGIVGIGGLGHMGIKFANAWGCEVTAFTSSESKSAEARSFGAHHVVSSRDPKALAAAAWTLDLLVITANVSLDWPTYLETLKPKGRLHFVGAIPEPIGFHAFSLIFTQRTISGSPTGSPTMIASMLDFAARHKLAPQVEYFPMSRVNDALEHLAAGKARYRIVLNAAE